MSAYKQFNEYLKSLGNNYDVGEQDYLAGLKGGSAGLTRDQTQALIHQDMLANTQYQRGVQDIVAAGLNPALMYGGSASPAPVSSAPSSNVGKRFDMALQAMSLPMQLMQMKAQVDATRAQVDNTIADTDLKRSQSQIYDLDRQFLLDTLKDRVEQVSQNVHLTKQQIGEINDKRNLLKQQLETEKQNTKNAEEHWFVEHWSAQLNKANAEQIAALLPYEIAFKKAATQAQRAAAAASFTHAAYEQGLIDAGFIDAQVQQAINASKASGAAADVNKQMALYQEYKNACRTGNIGQFLLKFDNPDEHWTMTFGNSIIGGITLVTETLGNVFGGVLK